MFFFSVAVWLCIGSEMVIRDLDNRDPLYTKNNCFKCVKSAVNRIWAAQI
jgi:hypothetical protein